MFGPFLPSYALGADTPVEPHFTARSHALGGDCDARRCYSLLMMNSLVASSIAPQPSESRTVSARAGRPRGAYDLSLDELESQVLELGFPAYRARQIWGWAYRQCVGDYPEMANIPVALRDALAARAPLSLLDPVRAVAAGDGQTIKTLYRTRDDLVLETVLMLYPNRATVCVSCQVGCAVGCAFCATGLMGLSRNLGAGEMVAQVVGAAREARRRGRELTNIVMMGMGEPLQNYAEMMKFINIIHDPDGLDIGARRITVSTSGIVPKIDALAAEPLQFNLAISLHAPDDELRSRLVPINRRYPIAMLMAAVDRYIEITGRRVSFEYALMRGLNDGEQTARDLATLLGSRLCHVNIIPLNPVELLPYERPDQAGIERFADILRTAGIPTSVRYSRGLDIDAACGQLRAKELGDSIAPRPLS
jgi:23S rRNA (adenine2503-C2)-methyltransferase